MRAPHLGLAVLLLVAPAPAARAQTPAPVDSGQFVIFDRSVPIAHEHYDYRFMGDSLVVTATARRQLQDEKGQRHEFKKIMQLVVDSRDLGLMRYVSDQWFLEHETIRGLLPTDTVLTHYEQTDGAGTAERVVEPPGRLFVLDSQLFTLFDVLCRSLADKQFVTRRVQLVAFGRDTLTLPVATITLGKPDTLLVDARRVPVRHYSLEDQGVRFELWADAGGRMVRMANEPSGLSVERVLESKPAPAPKHPVVPRRRPPVRR
ncbi:MAG TPA: hypothetical protein VI504_15525 [Candidatus Eisenbacteria bacterium]|jgi:hypothetical protein